MIGRAFAPYIVGAGLAAAGLAGWWVYSTGADNGRAQCRAEIAAQTAEMQQRIDDLAADRRAAELALERAERYRNALERELADDAMDDPMANSPGLGLDSLRRHDRIGRPGKAEDYQHHQTCRTQYEIQKGQPYDQPETDHH